MYPAMSLDGDAIKVRVWDEENRPVLSTETRLAALDFDERAQPVSVWTRPAKLFVACISGFVVATVILLTAVMVLQPAAAVDDAVQTFTITPFVMQGLTIVCELVLLGAAIFAIKTQNMVSVAAVLIFNVYLVVGGFLEAGERTAVFSVQGMQDPGPLYLSFYISLWLVPVIDLCFHLGSDWAAYRLYRELGWSAYRQSSADRVFGRLHRRVLVLRALAFFTFVFLVITLWTTLVVFFVWIPTIKSAGESDQPFGPKAQEIIPPLIIHVVLVAGSLTLMSRGVEWENGRWVWVSIGCQVLAIASYAVVVGLITPTLTYTNSDTHDTMSLRIAWRLYFQYGVAMIVLLCTLFMSVVVLRGFGRGLKERREAQLETRPTEQRESLLVD